MPTLEFKTNIFDLNRIDKTKLSNLDYKPTFRQIGVFLALHEVCYSSWVKHYYINMKTYCWIDKTYFLSGFNGLNYSSKKLRNDITHIIKLGLVDRKTLHFNNSRRSLYRISEIGNSLVLY